jgi:uncharacterized protein YbjT (DUF2867 family)
VKKILVTRADGFIGARLTEALVRAGHELRTATRNCDAVLHLPALIAIPYSSQRHGASATVAWINQGGPRRVAVTSVAWREIRVRENQAFMKQETSN